MCVLSQAHPLATRKHTHYLQAHTLASKHIYYSHTPLTSTQTRFSEMHTTRKNTQTSRKHTLLAWPHTSRNTHTIIKHTQYLQTHTYIACIAEKDATQILSSLHHNFINYRCMFSMSWHIRLRSTFSECILWIADYFDNMSISDGQGMGFLQKFIKQMTNGKE